MPIDAIDDLREVSDERLAGEIQRIQEWLDSHRPSHGSYPEYAGYLSRLEEERFERRYRELTKGLERGSSHPLEDAFRSRPPITYRPRHRPDGDIELDIPEPTPGRPADEPLVPRSPEPPSLRPPELPRPPENFADLIRSVDKLPPLHWLPWSVGPSVVDGLWRGITKFPKELDPELFLYEPLDGSTPSERLLFRPRRPPSPWDPSDAPDLWTVYTFPRTIHGDDWEDAFKRFGKELGRTVWKEAIWPRLRPNLWPFVEDHPKLTTVLVIATAAGFGGYVFYQVRKEEEVDLGLGVVDFKYDLDKELIDFGFNFSVLGVRVELESEGWSATQLRTLRGRDFRSVPRLRRLWDRIEPADLKLTFKFKIQF